MKIRDPILDNFASDLTANNFGTEKNISKKCAENYRQFAIDGTVINQKSYRPRTTLHKFFKWLYLGCYGTPFPQNFITARG